MRVDEGEWVEWEEDGSIPMFPVYRDPIGSNGDETQTTKVMFGCYYFVSIGILLSHPQTSIYEKTNLIFLFTNSAPLGRVGHRVAMSVCVCVCGSVPSGAVFF